MSCGKLSSVILGNGITKVYKGDNDDGNVDNNGSVFYPSFEECDSLKTLSIASYDGMDMFLHSDAKIKIQTLVISKDYADTEIKTKAYQKAGLYAGWYEKISDKSFARLVCNVTTPPKIDDQFSSQQYASLEVLVPTSSLAAYQAADVWKKFWGLKGGAENFNIVTGISSPTMTKESRPRAIYNLNGMRIDAPRPGINIIRMSDGTTKKVLVK